MNIFVLDTNPVIAAQLQCDKHVVKMLLESAQMLSTAHRIVDNNDDEKLYRAAHQNHPCSKWVRETDANYKWLYDHFVGLCDEYTYRYKKVHLSDTKLRDVLKDAPKNIKHGGLTKFALAMGTNPECIQDDAVESYRAFYKTKQDRFKMVWTGRQIPNWFN